MASVQANGITIEYEERGAGEPLLMVMGLGGQLVDWPHELVDLFVDQGFRVIRFDNRDSGLSTEFTSEPPSTSDIVKATLLRRQLPAEYRLSDMAGDAMGLLDALDVESAHVMGISMGGMIAQTIAVEHPGRVRSLTSIMSTTGSRKVGQPKLNLVRKYARRQIPGRDQAVELGVETFRDICGPTFDEARFRELAALSVARSFRPAGTARQTAAIIASPDRTPALRSVDVPTLVIHGMLDPLVAPSGGEATARAIPGSRLLMFPDMGHDLPVTRWHEIVEEATRNAQRASDQQRRPVAV